MQPYLTLFLIFFSVLNSSTYSAHRSHIVDLANNLSIQSDTTRSSASEAKAYDIIIYGGTSSGVAAAIQASRMGKSVVLIEPSSRLGGLTTGGLGQTDIGNKQVIGGIAREFYQNIRQYYDNPVNWNWQKPED